MKVNIDEINEMLYDGENVEVSELLDFLKEKIEKKDESYDYEYDLSDDDDDEEDDYECPICKLIKLIKLIDFKDAHDLLSEILPEDFDININM